MSLSDLDELEKKILVLRELIVKEHGSAYALGFMESLFTRIIKAYVPANRHGDVIDLINMHIDGINNAK